MIYNNLEVLDEYYSTAPDGSIGGFVVTKNMLTGKISFYLASRSKYTTERKDIGYFLNSGFKIPVERIKFFINQIDEMEEKKRNEKAAEE